MINQLLEVIDPQRRRVLRRMLVALVGSAVLQGIAFVLLIPSLRALLGPEPGTVWPWLWVLAGITVAYAVAYHLGLRMGAEAGATLSQGLHHRIGDHVATLPLGWFSTERVGQLSTLAGQSVFTIMGVPAHLLRPLVTGFLTPATVVVAMFFVDWRLALAATATVPVIALVYRWSSRLTERADEISARAQAEAAGRVIEFAQTQRVLRAFGQVSRGHLLLDEALAAQRRASRDVLVRGVPGQVGFALVIQASFTAVMVYGTYLVLGGSLAAPELLALLVLAARFVEPMAEAAALGSVLRSAGGALRRVRELLAAEPLPEPARPRMPAGSAVEFDDVSFGYDGTPVLDGVSFLVPEHTMTALVGPSGAGKTTIIRLIARFWDVDSGSVRVGGVDVRDIDSEELMSRISMVFQDVYLFEGTIGDNIRVGRPDATPEQVRDAARLARVDEIVARLPDGWQTRVGEGGARLSGGERQRVSIARAILKDAPIVLLDEATASLDPENEEAVQDALSALTADRTLLVIAHRLRTVTAADEILVLDGGRIAERGTHDELLAANGRYAAFWAERSRAGGWRLARSS